jgi:DNA oxidative demethylase
MRTVGAYAFGFDLAVGEGAVLLRSYAAVLESEIFAAIQSVESVSPFRHMFTPGGYRMSVAMTNCGRVGWITDRSGYRYSSIDPLTEKPWPALPEVLLRFAREAACDAGYQSFHPDVCLINRYEPGAKMSLHQDKDERDFTQPIVSLSLGLPATFLFGGMKRTDPTARIRLVSGDVVVWGGPSRLAFHGVAPLAKGVHPLTGPCRINLTFRRGL